MDRLPVDSSLIRSIGYDFPTSVLEVDKCCHVCWAELKEVKTASQECADVFACQSVRVALLPVRGKLTGSFVELRFTLSRKHGLHALW